MQDQTMRERRDAKQTLPMEYAWEGADQSKEPASFSFQSLPGTSQLVKDSVSIALMCSSRVAKQGF